MATYNGHQEDSSGNILLAIPNSMATSIETGSTSSQAYTKGSYFFYNNRLVKANNAISSGATLTIGSNISYVNAADELSAHLRANDTSKSEFYFDVYNGKYGYYPNASKTASQFVPFGGTIAKSATGSYTITSTTEEKTITLDFTPKYICVVSADGKAVNTYNYSRSSTTATYGGSGIYTNPYNLPSTSSKRIKQINSNGFTMNATDKATYYWFAIE